jgi:hypothetical protein
MIRSGCRADSDISRVPFLAGRSGWHFESLVTQPAFQNCRVIVVIGGAQFRDRPAHYLAGRGGVFGYCIANFHPGDLCEALPAMRGQTNSIQGARIQLNVQDT